MFDLKKIVSLYRFSFNSCENKNSKLLDKKIKSAAKYSELFLSNWF